MSIQMIGWSGNSMRLSTLVKPFDYTKWHQEMADSMTQEEFDRIVEEAERTSPYTGDPSTIL